MSDTTSQTEQPSTAARARAQPLLGEKVDPILGWVELAFILLFAIWAAWGMLRYVCTTGGTLDGLLTLLDSKWKGVLILAALVFVRTFHRVLRVAKIKTPIGEIDLGQMPAVVGAPTTYENPPMEESLDVKSKPEAGKAVNTLETLLPPNSTFEIPVMVSAPGTLRYRVDASAPVDSFVLDANNRENYHRGDTSFSTWASVREDVKHSNQVPLPFAGRWYVVVRNKTAQPVRVQAETWFLLPWFPGM